MNSGNRQSQDVGRFFSQFASKWSTLYGSRRNVFWRWFDWTFRKDIYDRYEWTFAALGEDLGNKTILDIGCGNGVYAFEAARRGAALVLGLDIAEGMIDLCNARRQELQLEKTTRFLCAGFPPAVQVTELQQKFDAAIVMGVMDYIPDPAAFLAALRERVSQFALISFPGREWLRWQIRRCRYKLLGRCAVFHYVEAEVRDCCRRAGFGAIDLQYLRHSGGCYLVKARV